MRITNILLPLTGACLLAAGCTKEYITNEYYDETIIKGTEMTMLDFNVRSSNWLERDGYFEAILEVPEITADVVNDGHVQVSRLYNDGGVMTWTPLPAMRVGVDQIDGQDFYYTTYTDFEWSVGYVHIFVTTTDLYTGINPGDISFRVIITTQ